MKFTLLHGAIITALLTIGGSAWAQPAPATPTPTPTPTATATATVQSASGSMAHTVPQASAAPVAPSVGNSGHGTAVPNFGKATHAITANRTARNGDIQVSATPQTGSPGNPNADKPPMQAQELASLVPKDSSQHRPMDISKANVNSHYRYDKSGVNCSLYPARCRGEDY